MTRFFLKGKALLAGRSQSAEQDSECYASLQQQIPFIYAVALANFFGLKIVAGDNFISAAVPVLFLIMLVLWRVVHWISIRGKRLNSAAIRSELNKTLFFVALLSIGFSIWSQVLLSSNPTQVQGIVLFSSLTAVGCTFGLSSYRPAARLPLLLLGFPLALRLETV